MMKKIILLALLFISINAFSQNQQEKYSKVKIDLLGKKIIDLAKLGIEVDHGIIVPNRFIINDYSIKELKKIRKAKFKYEVIIDDVVSWYQDQNRDFSVLKSAVPPPPTDCFNASSSNEPVFQTPTNYSYGSMGGYLTYTEFLNTLDSMYSKFPNLITQRAPIGTINDTTWRGNRIQWVKISDNPNVNEVEPEVLFTSLHHAREPNSLAQNIFYMWYLLENYSTDSEIQYLVDNTEIYFIPMVNPDGYIMNQENQPNGGGMIRKNGRDNDNNGIYNNQDGVDLNRNYGFQWAFDNSGSSPNFDAQTYRGPSAFSEPETQAVRDFCNDHEFQITLNYHTYGNLLIHPWGFTDVITSEHETFRMLGLEMTQYNNFLFGTGSETVGYTVNGDSDDWMYGETVTKGKIYSLTPEIGTTGFWPMQSEIDDLNKSVMHQNLSVSRLVLNYVEALEQNPSDFIFSNTGSFEFQFVKKGLKTGDVTVNISSLDPNLSLTFSPQVVSLLHLETQDYTIPYSVDVSTNNNDELKFLISIDNGMFTYYDTIVKIFNSAILTEVFNDNTNNLSNWNTGTWALTTSEYHTAPNCITESPNGDYNPGANNSITLSPVDLTFASFATISFWAKWDIENDYDYTQILISTDNGANFIPLCGEYSNEGTGNQDFEMPLYDGIQNEWVEEVIDITEYVGNVVLFKFKFKADWGVEADGFYFDDFKVNAIIDAHTDNVEITEYSCNEADTGTVSTTYTNIWNMDSVYTINTLLADNYLIEETQYTTNTSSVGITSDTFSTIYGCDSIIETTTILDPTINIVELEDVSISIYPNPVNDKLSFKLVDNSKNVEINIQNSLGQNINSFTIKKEKDSYIYDMTNFPRGLYFVRIEIGNAFKTLRIVKE